jgi:hypothetical protein
MQRFDFMSCQYNKNNIMRNLFFVLVTLAILSSCKKEKDNPYSKYPLCVQGTIKQAMKSPPSNNYVCIAAYKYHDSTMYLFIPDCPDCFHELKDENCRYLFAPSGGFTGAGDMTHPDFKTNAIYLGEVWKK